MTVIEEIMPLGWRPCADARDNADARLRAIDERNRNGLLRWHVAAFGQTVGRVLADQHWAEIHRGSAS